MALAEKEKHHWISLFDSRARRPTNGEPMLVKTAPGEIVRYRLGTWEVGRGWEDFTGRNIYSVTHFIPLRYILKNADECF